MKERILSSSTITGKNVQNLEGENIGDIKELMIDPQNGEVAYAVLSFGGFMGIGSKYFAVPIQTLRFGDKDDSIVMDIDKKVLENAPSFDKDNWPKTANPEFMTSVYSHYGVEHRRHRTVV